MRTSKAIRAGAWAVVAAGVAAPLLRRRLNLRPPVVIATAAAAPAALCVAMPRSRTRDVGTCVLQMLAYLAAYEMPNDDPERLQRRVKIAYPVKIDRALGLGTLPNLRLQRRFARRDHIRRLDQTLVWAHWIWFTVPHSALAFVLFRRRDQFERAALMTYAVFDLGACVYWLLPTAPPWYAAMHGYMGGEDGEELRRLMVEHGEAFWRDGWQPLYSLLGGNPLAAMPSLHFATSVMAAHVLSDAGTIPGVVGWTYALTLGFALVYLGEHYVVDLLAGLTLTESVRRFGPRATPLLRRAGAVIQSLEQRAQVA